MALRKAGPGRPKGTVGRYVRGNYRRKKNRSAYPKEKFAGGIDPETGKRRMGYALTKGSAKPRKDFLLRPVLELWDDLMVLYEGEVRRYPELSMNGFLCSILGDRVREMKMSGDFEFSRSRGGLGSGVLGLGEEVKVKKGRVKGVDNFGMDDLIRGGGF